MTENKGDQRLQGNNFLHAAEIIGDKLCDEAFWFDDRCNWIGRALDDVIDRNSPPANMALLPDLYGGTSGIALFLSNLYLLTKKDVYKKTSEGSIIQALSRLEDLPVISRFGVYSGQLGIAYSSYKVGLSLDLPPLIEKSSQILRNLYANMETEHLMDIITGNAGAIPTLLYMNELLDEEYVLDFAFKLGKELILSAVKESSGWSWDYRANGVKNSIHNLTGYAHGAAGIGCALFELFEKTDNREFFEGAIQAFKYEDAWFNKKFDNWPDFRTYLDPNRSSINSNSTHTSSIQSENKQYSYAVAWCHGAPGIGLSRLRVSQILKDEKYQDDIHASLRIIKGVVERIINIDENATHNNDFSLCHGLAGLGEILLYATSVLGDESYFFLTQKLGSYGVEKFQKRGLPWPCGVKTSETPGLMLGTAGIGNFYLRLHDADKVTTPLIIIPTNTT
ncbi:MAG: hypothetical protein KGH85_05220 [Thaumarchaeota archaeon]|nr:hypothetical protein [Nitrososphaerota archaeon]